MNVASLIDHVNCEVYWVGSNDWFVDIFVYEYLHFMHVNFVQANYILKTSIIVNILRAPLFENQYSDYIWWTRVN